MNPRVNPTSVSMSATGTAISRMLSAVRRPGTPLLLLREPHYDPAGKAVLFAVNYHNSDLVQFTLARAGWRT